MVLFWKYRSVKASWCLKSNWMFYGEKEKNVTLKHFIRFYLFFKSDFILTEVLSAAPLVFQGVATLDECAY